MKINIKLTVCYDGTNYLGWQRLGKEQHKKTVQGMLEQCLSEIVCVPVKLIGAGRTDAGVHAIAQVANFWIEDKRIFLETSADEADSIAKALDRLRSRCNRMLPEDIRIVAVEKAADDFHSRYSAVQKQYVYKVDNRESAGVFDRKYMLHEPCRLAQKDMQEAAELLLGTHDFSAFSVTKRSGTRTEKKDTVRTLYEICITEIEGQFSFRFTGDGFLYHMVRIMVGTLLEVGRGERKSSSVRVALESGERAKAGSMAAAHGLFLEKIIYEDE